VEASDWLVPLRADLVCDRWILSGLGGSDLEIRQPAAPVPPSPWLDRESPFSVSPDMLQFSNELTA
jgi:hypothetical protein